jgi:hypothetical protein
VNENPAPPGEQTPDDPGAGKLGVAPNNRPALTFAGALALLTTLLTAAGVTDGVVGRMFGESPVLIGIAVGLALLGALLSIVAGLFTDSKKHPKGERWLLTGSNLVLFVGLCLGIYAATRVWSNTRAPTLTADMANAEGSTRIDLTAKASGLDSKEHMKIVVEQLGAGRENDSHGNEVGTLRGVKGTIYSAWIGSTEDGKVEYETSVRVPPHVTGKIGARAFVGKGSANCYKEPGEDEACVEVTIPHDPETLQLTAGWGSSKEALAGSLKARNIPELKVYMRAIGQVRGTRTTNRLMEIWQLTPDVNGHFDRTFTIHGVKRFTWVCIVAGTQVVKRCPPRQGERKNVVWSRYRVPDDGSRSTSPQLGR